MTSSLRTCTSTATTRSLPTQISSSSPRQGTTCHACWRNFGADAVSRPRYIQTLRRQTRVHTPLTLPGVTVVLTAALGLPEVSETGEGQAARVPPAPAHRHEYGLPVAAEVDRVRVIPKREDLKVPDRRFNVARTIWSSSCGFIVLGCAALAGFRQPRRRERSLPLLATIRTLAYHGVLQPDAPTRPEAVEGLVPHWVL